MMPAGIPYREVWMSEGGMYLTDALLTWCDNRSNTAKRMLANLRSAH